MRSEAAKDAPYIQRTRKTGVMGDDNSGVGIRFCISGSVEY